MNTMNIMNTNYSYQQKKEILGKMYLLISKEMITEQEFINKCKEYTNAKTEEEAINKAFNQFTSLASGMILFTLKYLIAKLIKWASIILLITAPTIGLTWYLISIS